MNSRPAILIIGDIHELKIGISIGGAIQDEQLDHTTLIGKEIRIEHPDGNQLRTTVLATQLTSSIADKRNLFLLLPAEVRNGVKVGGIVYLTFQDDQ